MNGHGQDEPPAGTEDGSDTTDRPGGAEPSAGESPAAVAGESPAAVAGESPAAVAGESRAAVAGAPDAGQASVCPAGQTLAAARTRVYLDGRLAAEGFPVGEISERLTQAGAVVWLDLAAPTEADLLRISEEFSLDPLAVEDAVAVRERPKLDRYADHLFLNLYATYLDTQSGALATSEIAAFVTPRALITVRKDEQFDAGGLTAVWDANPDLATSGVGFLLHGLLDLVVDSHFAAVEALDDELEGLADDLFEVDRAGKLDVPRRSFALRKSLVGLRRVVLPMREVVNALMRRNLEVVDEAMTPSYQDVYDHVLRATEWTESLRDFVTTILETHLTIQSNRLNETMKKLTGWAAIIAVPTAVTGFFGQNVPYPGFQHRSGLYASVAIMVGVAFALYLMFKRRGWL